MIVADLIAQIEKSVPPIYSMVGDEPQFFGSSQTLHTDISKVTVMMDYYSGQIIPEDTEFLVLHHPPKAGIPPLPTYVLHSGWDAFPGGAGDALADVFELTERSLLDASTRLGRIGKLPDGEVSLDEFAKQVAKKLGRPYLQIVSEIPGVSIETVAVVSGFGLNPSMIKLAKQKGADVFLSGDMTHPGAILAKSLKIPLIDATHYATELPGLYRLRDLIASFGVKSAVFDTSVPWRMKTYYENY